MRITGSQLWRPQTFYTWFAAWKKAPCDTDGRVHDRRSSRKVRQHHLKRSRGAGAPCKAPLVREELFRWFIAMRYSIDWKALDAQRRSCGKHKCVGRFPRRLLCTKLQQLMGDHCRAALLAGVQPQGFHICSRWLREFECEFGVSFRQPNRKFKVPKFIAAERCVLWWISTARLRALAEETLNYDLEMENFDQSPYHHNETGSQDVRTLAVAGSNTVPVLEGHHDVRARWTSNMTTISEILRIRSGDIPMAQMMFKADGERLELRLRAHIRSRGYGPWISVATSDSGSCKTSDILAFLDQHLPRLENGRRWRLMFSDDYAAHTNDSVFRLCWSRGYVMVPHGGGVTPLTQTVDTDLNKTVRAEYSALEAAHLVEQMRAGVTIPNVPPEQCIDMM